MPSRYLQSLINIRKDTIKLVKIRDDDQVKYNIEFRFDSDCDVKIRIHYFAVEHFTANNVDNQCPLSYKCGCGNYSKAGGNKTAQKCFCLNEDNCYPKGANILFQQSQHFISPAKFDFHAVSGDLAANIL